MKLAISSESEALDGNVDPRFGRCAFFIIIDSETMMFERFSNPALMAPGGAGIEAAQFILSKDVDAVITGNLGPNAFRVLSAAGMKCYGAYCRTVREAVEDFVKGRLRSIDSSKAPGSRWAQMNPAQ